MGGTSLLVQWLRLRAPDARALALIPSKGTMDCKEIQSVHPKGDQSWVFTGRTDAEAETPVLWPPHAKS